MGTGNRMASGLASMSVKTWKSIADWATIVFIALTVVSGSAALILGDRINEKQAEKLREFNKELTEAKTRQAEAEIKLAEVRKKQEPRWIQVEKFVAAFGKARRGKAF